MGRLRELGGKRFGRVTVIELAQRARKTVRWSCRCDCGTVFAARSGDLVSGDTKSCGCLNTEVRRSAKTHGLGKPPAWQSWVAMRKRCSTGNWQRHLYFDRGITVCERWQLFENFLADMGQRPPGMTLDRIDNDKGYDPGNCRWATPTQQRNNRRDTKLYTYAGKKMTLTDWVREITGHTERHQHKYAYSLRRRLES